MNDYQKTKSFLERLHNLLETNKHCMIEADQLIGKNQNQPPIGEADGSFTPEQWVRANASVQTLKDAQRRLRAFLTNHPGELGSESLDFGMGYPHF